MKNVRYIAYKDVIHIYLTILQDSANNFNAVLHYCHVNSPFHSGNHNTRDPHQNAPLTPYQPETPKKKESGPIFYLITQNYYLTKLYLSANILNAMSTICQTKSIKFSDFLENRDFFTVEEADAFLARYRSGNVNTRKALLYYYQENGRIVSIQRGLYAVVPKGTQINDFQIDPFLLASRAVSDAVLSHHTALEFHGRAYSLFNYFTVISSCRFAPLRHRDYNVRWINIPKTIQMYPDYEVETHHRLHSSVKVTSLERTMVDVLERPELGGGWEEVWRSLEMIEFFDLSKIETYLYYLNNATTTAKVGFYLSQHRESLMVDDAVLARLKRRLSKQPHYFARHYRKESKLIKDWNLFVPLTILEERWKEFV